MKQVEEEDDPFDAYMKEIEGQATTQQNVMYPGYDEDDQDMSNDNDNLKKATNVITMDDIIGSTGEDQKEEEEEDEQYRQ